MASTSSGTPSGTESSTESSTTSGTTSDEFDKATDYSFQESDIEAAKALVGVWSPLNTQEFLTEATYDNMRNFARGYGDDNPLFTSAGYGETTRWGSQIGAPMMPIAMNRPLFGDAPEVKLRRPSFRGIHVFVSGSSWDWFRPINAGDQLFSFGGTEKIVEKDSEFAERSMQLTKTMVRFNQRAEIVAISRTLLIHTERKTARERGKYDEIGPATYSDDDIAEIDAIYAAEQARGSVTRWFEDVAIGDALTPMAKGPLTTTDMIVFHAGGYGFIPYAPTTNRVAYKNRQRIAPFYVKNEYGVPDVAQRVHWDSAWAQAIGNPMAYDYGVMRDCWLSHFVTDWMGDDAWLVTQSSQIRKFNYIGDTHIITGEVVGKRVEEDGRCLVDIEMRGTNQRGTITCPGTATVALPSREHGAVVLPPPPAEYAQQAATMLRRHGEIVRDEGRRELGLMPRGDTTLFDSGLDAVRVWVDEQWDPDLTVREWWRRLFEAGYSHPTWPAGTGGLGTTAADARRIHGLLAATGVIAPPTGHVASGLAAPTILDHGTAAQIADLVPPIARGEVAWCQLFSEPGAGSDLASVGARAVRDGDEWVVTGQKVWNSAADLAQRGMLLARTDPDQPKHRGLTYFVVDMDQPGVETRPLTQMNRSAEFCEVFLDAVRIPADRVIGELNGGWSVAQTTLGHERRSIAGRGIPGLFPARSGPAAGDLDLTCGEVIERARTSAKTSRIPRGAVPGAMMIDLAREYGMTDDPVIRQRLARYHSNIKMNGWINQRIGAAGGRLTGADGSVSKVGTSRICVESAELAFDVIGANTMLDGADAPMNGELHHVGLASPGKRIGGGTDEIQLNVIGERALGLPREPGNDQDVPYRDLKVGTQR